MIKKLSIALMLALVLACTAFAQIPIVTTTLSSAMLVTDRVAFLTSGTSVVVPALAGTGGVLGSILVIDNEAMQVMSAGPTSTSFIVKRGIYPNLAGAGNTLSRSGTLGLAHGKGAKVYVLGPTTSTGDPSRPVATANFLSQKPYQPGSFLTTPSVNGVATTSVTDVSGTFFISSIEVDYNMISTGACWLNGATVTTDKHIIYLWDATGTLLANSALAGVADATFASIYECTTWTTPVGVFGPAQYFVGVQANGTTDNVQMYITGGVSSNYPTTSQAGTFGTTANITTIPTTFTTAVGPLMWLQQ